MCLNDLCAHLSVATRAYTNNAPDGDPKLLSKKRALLALLLSRSHGWGARLHVEPSLSRGAPLVLHYPFTPRDCLLTHLSPPRPTRHSAKHP